ncbi:AAA family ATPase [Paractinoplanes atraurantiacus]|uniref:Shikimate kinase n=1 Tax=Paractinoplanes atraurantiacus TaxID=1036182 RepID=A0A285HDF2_9ACTN|nr:AAA family ATPase [Actinoplanes atraurantiacus]SNY33779.1 shikimate kinase [Actinoplanes atraurantiacus]
MGDLLFIIGPPAVGKMTVGNEIAARTGLRVFHNHLAIEPVLRFFEFGTPAFSRLVQGFRQAVLEEVAASDLPGLIFTYVWAFDSPGDAQSVRRYAEPFARRGGRVLFLELEADQQERLRRNTGESRLAEKPSKRNLERSRDLLLRADRDYRLNSTDEFKDDPSHVRLDTTHLQPAEVAERAIERLGLRR